MYFKNVAGTYALWPEVNEVRKINRSDFVITKCEELLLANSNIELTYYG